MDCAEDEEMYEAELPLDNEEVKALYSHTAWESPQDDPFAAEVIRPLLSPFLPRDGVHSRSSTFP